MARRGGVTDVLVTMSLTEEELEVVLTVGSRWLENIASEISDRDEESAVLADRIRRLTRSMVINIVRERGPAKGE